MICPNCGTENEKRSVCSKCGTFLNNNSKNRITDPEILKKMRRERFWSITKGCALTTIMGILAFIVVTVVMVIVFHFVFKNLDLPDLGPMTGQSTPRLISPLTADSRNKTLTLFAEISN